MPADKAPVNLGPFHCPFCQSHNVSPLPTATQEVMLLCLRCHETFIMTGRPTPHAKKIISRGPSGT